MNRRKWLKLAAASTGVAAVAGGVGYTNRDLILRLQASDFAELIRENFHYLKLDVSDAQIETFYALYIEHCKHIARGIFLRLNGRDEDYVAKQLDRMLMTFLLSTDFFLNGADESKSVRFMTFYDPYISPCWNPVNLGAAVASAAEQESEPGETS